jgi:hypothetical protein
MRISADLDLSQAPVELTFPTEEQKAAMDKVSDAQDKLGEERTKLAIISGADTLDMANSNIAAATTAMNAANAAAAAITDDVIELLGTAANKTKARDVKESISRVSLAIQSMERIIPKMTDAQKSVKEATDAQGALGENSSMEEIGAALGLARAAQTKVENTEGEYNAYKVSFRPAGITSDNLDGKMQVLRSSAMLAHNSMVSINNAAMARIALADSQSALGTAGQIQAAANNQALTDLALQAELSDITLQHQTEQQQSEIAHNSETAKLEIRQLMSELTGFALNAESAGNTAQQLAINADNMATSGLAQSNLDKIAEQKSLYDGAKAYFDEKSRRFNVLIPNVVDETARNQLINDFRDQEFRFPPEARKIELATQKAQAATDALKAMESVNAARTELESAFNDKSIQLSELNSKLEAAESAVSGAANPITNARSNSATETARLAQATVNATNSLIEQASGEIISANEKIGKVESAGTVGKLPSDVGRIIDKTSGTNKARTADAARQSDCGRLYEIIRDGFARHGFIVYADCVVAFDE